MLTKAVFENLQRHEKIVLEFDRVTTLVGRSHRGKSAIVRGLGFALLNLWSAGFVRRPGAEPLRATLTIDGKVVTRVKGKRVNTVAVGGKEFAALGRGDLPPEVAALLNVGRDNFQFQLDPHFWFAESAGTVAKNINRMVDLEVIDTAQAKVAAGLRKAKANLEFATEQYELHKAEAWALAWVGDFDRDLKVLEELKRQSERSAEKSRRIVSLVSPLSDLKSRLDRLSGARIDGEKLVALGARLQNTRRKRLRLEKILARLAAIKLVKAPDLTPVLELRAKADASATRRAFCEQLVDETEQTWRNLCRIRKQLAEARSRLAELEKALPRCPTCGQLKRPSPSRSYAPTSTSRTPRPGTGPSGGSAGTMSCETTSGNHSPRRPG